jgi:hypothetical protein
LGIKFKKDPQGQFAHSNVITILNPAGEIVRQLTGLNLDVALAIKAVRKTSLNPRNAPVLAEQHNRL